MDKRTALVAELPHLMRYARSLTRDADQANDLVQDTTTRALSRLNLFQAGTNMSMVRLADEAERWLGKPVVAINAATMWHALRDNGFTDQMDGFGSLLSKH